MIRFLDAAKAFGGRAAVHPLSLDIRPGEVTALLGPNGSGKTTTLKMAAGLIKPDGGAVTIDGESAWNARARARLAYLPQRVSFAEGLTGVEIVEFFRRLRGAPPDSTGRALRFAALNGASARSVATYSGGMIQRLGLAVATLPGTDVLLLDEPGAALDPEGLDRFYQVLEDARRGRTVLFTSHQVADIERVADRVVVLAEGRLVADVPRRELQQWRDVHGTMRVRIANPPDALRALEAVNAQARIEGREIVFAGASASRAGVLEVIRAAGIDVEGLVAEPAPLEAFYASLLGGRTDS